ncbi:MAG: proprotein convertase P-domain-containing protein [Phaeodactylibacter sp.]|nr:proprotein convertase P-domain-containing protein [Phaeodactylibacter sp.]MCB9049782.1 proprotein convertase P-domain-containing protein [Lewinellaceae bacterium]
MNPSTPYPLFRGGQQLSISKVPDEFTIRSVPGVDQGALSRSMGCRMEGQMAEQQLAVLSVEPDGLEEAMARLRASREVAFASHTYSIDNDPIGRFYLTDEVTVQFFPEVSRRIREELMEGEGLTLIKAIKGVDDGYVYRLSAGARANPLKLAQQLNQLPEVRYCEANVVIPCLHHYEPTDTLFKHQWYLQHNGGLQLEKDAHIDIVRAWDVTKGARSIIVAVVDDFIDTSHRDFSGSGKIVAPLSLKDPEGGLPKAGRGENHGTACAGLAVAEENGLGIVGAAPGCALMPIHSSGTIDDNAIELLFDWAIRKGASVLSNSWGVAAANFPLSIRQHAAIHRAATEGRGGKGCVICFAAGNANRPINGTVDESGWPGRRLLGPTRWYNGFTAHPDVITVAACTSFNQKAAYSNWGAEVSVCAPSNNGHPSIGPELTYPKVSVPFPGKAVYTTDRSGKEGYARSDYTSEFGGTSSACPLVAGVAALILSVNPGLTAPEVRAILESTADKIQDKGTDPQLGLRMGAYDEKGHSPWFGFGKVNAFRAVVKASGQDGQATKAFTGQSAPGVAITDNLYEGVADPMQVHEQGAVKSVEVSLRVKHPYIGDLKASLIAPSGKKALLHDKQGGGRNKIRKTYTLQNTPSLRELLGELAEGTWWLAIQDIAPRDSGTLEEWSLSLVFAPVQTILLEDKPELAIPDDQAFGIERALRVESEAIVKKVTLKVDIAHPFIGDLEVALRAPSGKAAVLHARKGGASDGLSTTYTSLDTPALQTLAGLPAKGEWAIRVRDLAFRDVGRLNRWALELVVEGR